MKPAKVKIGIGIPRSELPQIDTDNLPQIKKDMDNSGIIYTEGLIVASRLRPSQSELNQEKIQFILKDKIKPKPIIISKEGYIVDGHHTWAAIIVQNPNIRIPVICCQMNIIDLINWFNSHESTYTKNINESHSWVD